MKSGRISWIPAVVSAVALVAGLVGLVCANDWKLLLVVPPSFAFTELLDGVDSEWILGQDPRFAWRRRLIRWLESAILVIAAMLALTFPIDMMTGYAMPASGWKWHRICLYMGLVVMPWGYFATTAKGRMARWLLFLLAPFGALSMVMSPENGRALAVVLQLFTLVVMSAGVWLLKRKGMA